MLKELQKVVCMYVQFANSADSASQKQEPKGWKAGTAGAGISHRLPWLTVFFAAHLFFNF